MWAAWKLICLCLCLHTCCTMVLGEKSGDEISREYIAKFKKALNLTTTSDVKLPHSVGIAPPPKPFLCDTSKPDSYTPATKVTELTPWDISIVGAMGDSVTAGFGADAKNIIEDVIEYRWLSWSIGGAEDISKVSTLPNIIKKYNSDVKGYSVDKPEKNPGYNVAKSGAIAPDMLKQAEDLLNRMRADSGDRDILDNQWKVVTLWIGGNDLCATCAGTPEENAVAYVKNVNDSLRFLSDNFKRTYVNLVDMIDITQMIKLEGLWCSIVHPIFCRCATREDTKELVKETAAQYNVELKKMLEEVNYFNRDDFTVALQPFFSDTVLPELENGKPDSSYFAPDCFHFSTKGHGVGALYLWNNMLEEQDGKTEFIDWDDMQDYLCISEDYPYFAVNTAANLKGANRDNGVSTDSVPVIAGSVLAVVVVTIAAVVIVAVVIAYRRKKESTELSLEKLQLISVKI